MGNNTNNSQTKQYKIKTSKKANKAKNRESSNENKKRKNNKKSKVIKKIILTIFILIILLGLAAIGAFAAIFFSDDWAVTAEDLIANGNTEILDSKEKSMGFAKNLNGEGQENRKVITLDEMGRFTANAYVAIEDKRFYEHSGIDILRTAKATVSYILNRTEDSSVGGGSTITQQLVKNLMKDSADSGTEGIERKIREMSRAYQIEKMLSKPQIIEKYLNVIFVGGPELYGVEYGAKYYFAKSAKDLDLAESAFLAGINNAPNMYNPYDTENDHSELIKNRTKLVLNFMKEQNRISNDPEEAEKLYNEAVAKVEEGLKFKKGKFNIGTESYFQRMAIAEASEDLAAVKDISVDAAEDMIRSGGYILVTTQDSKIQEQVIKEMAKESLVQYKTIQVKDEKGKTVNKKIRTNAGMTIIDHTTGKVVAMGGDLLQDNGISYANYATSERQTGSSIKPLANIAPGLEEKIITASTVYDDTPTKFGNWDPHNVGLSYCGLCTVRRAIERSSNIVNIKIMSNIGVNKSIDYLHEFGLDSYVKGVDELGLAIGGATNGSSTLQMAAAYAALANKGVYIEPTFYTELRDSNGNVVVKSSQETRRVISEANAYIVSNILLDVVKGSEGTAWRCAISGMDVAAKTGTTDGKADKWLCGYTPYYAAAVWYGFGEGSAYKVSDSYANSAIYIWSNVMKAVHKNLKSAKFTKPNNVVTARVCKQSGKLATSGCSSTYTEYFVQGTVPTACTGHEKVKICKETGKVATEFCPETEEKSYTAKPEKELNASWKTIGKSSSSAVPTEQCDKHTAENSRIIIPNVLGKTEAEAREALLGLVVQVIEGTDSNIADGLVLRQSLAEGTEVDKGVTITLTINKKSASSGTTGSEGNTGSSSTPGNNQAPGTTGGSGTSEPSPTTTPTPSTDTPSGEVQGNTTT